MTTESNCPVTRGTHKHTASGAQSNRDWWPNQLNLQILHPNSPLSNPMGKDFNLWYRQCPFVVTVVKKVTDGAKFCQKCGVLFQEH